MKMHRYGCRVLFQHVISCPPTVVAIMYLKPLRLNVQQHRLIKEPMHCFCNVFEFHNEIAAGKDICEHTGVCRMYERALRSN